MQTQEKFDLWCIVELFGHQKISGKCTEQNIAGTNMLRVDVPETKTQPSFTRFFGSEAIYAINPVDELTANHYAEKLEVKPIDSWNISEILKKHNVAMLENKGSDDDELNLDMPNEDDNDDDDNDEDNSIF